MKTHKILINSKQSFRRISDLPEFAEGRRKSVPIAKTTKRFPELMQDHKFYYFLRRFIIHDYGHQLEQAAQNSNAFQLNQQNTNDLKDIEIVPSKKGKNSYNEITVVDVDNSDVIELSVCAFDQEGEEKIWGKSVGKKRQPSFPCDVEPHVLALHYLNFYTDTAEFEILPRSDFRALRAAEIVDTYIRHGAPSKLPFPRLLVDEIRKKFDARPEDPAADTFDGGRQEAVEYLEIEVWPIIQASGLLKRYEESGSIDPPRISLLYSSPQLTLQRDPNFEVASQPLQQALHDQEMCMTIKNFLRDHFPSDESALLFYLEAEEFEMTFKEMQAQWIRSSENQDTGTATDSSDKKVDSSTRYLILWAAKMYDKYLKLGAKQEVSVDTSTRLKLIADLSRNAFESAFTLAKEIAFRLLFQHYREFLASAYFKGLEELRKERAERRKLALKATLVKIGALKVLAEQAPKPKESRKHIRPVRSISFKKSSSQEAPKRHDSTPFDQSIGVQPADLRKKTKELYGTYFEGMRAANKLYYFQRHLQTVSMQHYLNFYTEVEEYEQIPYLKKAFIKGRAQKIYDKYLRMSGLQDIYVEEGVRNRILFSLPEPDRTIFNSVKESVYQVLLEEWPLFMQSDIYKNALEDGELAESLMRSQSSILLEDVPLIMILEDQMLANLFKEFCDQEFYPQTVRFWLDVEEFKRTPSGAFMETRCNKLLNMYIKEGAISPLPISDEARDAVEKNQFTPGPNLFEPAQTEVYEFMVSQLFNRFKKTDAFIENTEYVKRLKARHEDQPNEDVFLHSLDERNFKREVMPSENNIKALKRLLKSQSGVRFFKEFCEQIYCTENIFFWMEAEDYANIPQSERYLESFARKIVHKFIADHARMQINIPCSVKNEIIMGLDSPTPDMFVKAQTEVLQMMVKDTWPKFIASKHYREFLLYQTQRKQTLTNLHLGRMHL